MDFDLSADQREIKDVARQLLAARSTWAAVRAAADAEADDAALWAELTELGWPGIAVAEEHGGQGLGVVELAALLEELGYACAAVPFLPVALAAAAIQSGGSDEQRARWLPGLVDGSLGAAVGRRELAATGGGHAGPDAEAADGGAGLAAVAVVLADDGSAELIAGPAVERFVAIDPTRRYATVGGTGEPLGAGAAAVLLAGLAAETVGIAQRALDMTVAYVKDRKQFGVAVGSFQAVAHRCAQMLLDTESIRSTAYFAAWAADADPERAPEAAALAAAAAAEGGRDTCASAIQAHGGIGFTWEADVHWLYKRAQLDAALLGGGGRHRAALAAVAAERAGAPVA